MKSAGGIDGCYHPLKSKTIERMDLEVLREAVHGKPMIEVILFSDKRGANVKLF